MVRVLANSPAATNAFFSFNAAMAASPMTADLGKRIAIAVAQANDCRTCLAAHTAFGRAKGVPDHELANESSFAFFGAHSAKDGVESTERGCIYWPRDSVRLTLV
jgi:AhpD family alkylhydroperoxidase